MTLKRHGLLKLRLDVCQILFEYLQDVFQNHLLFNVKKKNDIAALQFYTFYIYKLKVLEYYRDTLLLLFLRSNWQHGILYILRFLLSRNNKCAENDFTGCSVTSGTVHLTIAWSMLMQWARLKLFEIQSRINTGF